MLIRIEARGRFWVLNMGKIKPANPDVPDMYIGGNPPLRTGAAERPRIWNQPRPKIRVGFDQLGQTSRQVR